MSHRRGIYKVIGYELVPSLAKVTEEGRVWYMSMGEYFLEPMYHDDVGEILDLLIPYELYEGV